MLRLAFLFSVVLAGQAVANSDCDASAVRWVEITSPKVETALGQPMADAVQIKPGRWGLAASSYIGASLVIEAGNNNDHHVAETLLLTDALVGCWQLEMETFSEKGKSMVADFGAQYSSERRATLRNAAEAIMKGED